MSKITSPISILEFGSTHVSLGIFDKFVLNQKLFYEEKIQFTRDNNFTENHPAFNLIIKAEKDLGHHLNDIDLVLDSPSIHSLDFSIKKYYENKKLNEDDINYLINELEQIVKKHNKDKDILHTIKSNIIFDNEFFEETEFISKEVNQAVVEIKFILINKSDLDSIKNLLLKKHISIKNIYCTSYIKSLSLINKLGISDYSSFIDIGLKKSSLSIYKDKKLLFLSSTHIGGHHITNDISKVLNLEYRNAEAEKIKFSKKNKIYNKEKDKELLTNIINSRLEEIIELLFFNCPIIKQSIFKSDLKLYFIGNGSKVLNKNLLSFGTELNFINEMSIIDEEKQDCCDGAARLNINVGKLQPKKRTIGIENKGFFEKLFDIFSNK
tara:strand:- start:1580 stop:2722 length:1143 start_codon:yes stop_codon:yes gene_type:complete